MTKTINISIFIAFYFIFGVYALHLGQDFNWDLQNYHFYNAYAFLHDRRAIDISPVGIQHFFSPILDITLYSLYTTLPPRYYTFIIGGSNGICAFGVYLVLSRIFMPKSYKSLTLILVCTLISMTGFSGLSQLGTNFGDNITINFIIFSILFLLYYIETEKKSHLIASAILLGIAPSLKLTTALYVITIGFSILVVLRPKITVLATYVIITLISFLCVDFIWMHTMWKELGNPLYPFFSSWPDPHNHIVLNDPRFFPRSITQWLLYPFFFLHENNLVSEIHMRDGRLALLYILCFIAVVGWIFGKISKLTKFFTVLSITSYIIWLCTFSIIRYGFFLETLTGMMLVLVLKDHLNSKKRQLIIAVVSLLVLIFTTRISSWGKVDYTHKFYETQSDFKAKNALIIVDTKPTGYIIPSLGSSNQYIGNIWPESSINDNLRKKEILNKYIEEKRDIYVLSAGLPNVYALNSFYLPHVKIDVSRCYNIDGYRYFTLCKATTKKVVLTKVKNRE